MEGGVVCRGPESAFEHMIKSESRLKYLGHIERNSMIRAMKLLN